MSVQRFESDSIEISSEVFDTIGGNPKALALYCWLEMMDGFAPLSEIKTKSGLSPEDFDNAKSFLISNGFSWESVDC